jgi:23S rRNA (cytidine1920-2'-O)/16S rRNA (cytidine1409-2'-O)-methyltransferase
VDVAFIGLEKVLPAICRSLKPGARIVALVKPQFQAGRDEVGKRGVVRDVQVHAAVIGRVVAWAVEHELRLLNLTTSPLLGPAGNKEFFLLLAYAPAQDEPLAHESLRGHLYEPAPADRGGAEHPEPRQSIPAIAAP